MTLEKVFDATVNISNPLNVCADKQRFLSTELRSKYEGRCFKGAYIVSIDSILKSGPVHIIRTNLSGEAYVDVQFKATVRVLSKWDILVGVEIISAQQLVVGAYYDHSSTLPMAAVSFAKEAAKLVEVYAPKQKVAVRVLVANHSPMQKQVSVYAIPLICDQSAQVWRLRGSLDQTATTELRPMFERVKAELVERVELVKTHKNNLWFFESLLYSFRTPAPGPDVVIESGDLVWTGPASDSPAVGTITNVIDIVRRVVEDGETVSVAGTWTRALELRRSSPLACCSSTLVPDAVDGVPRAVFADFLKNILDFLTATREFCELFPTNELIESHANIWAMMRTAQK